MSRNNQKRIFADVVSIDAWHTPFDGQKGVASLHVDAVFSTARLGGEEHSPIRFRLSLKRAEIVAIIPAGEPLDVLPSTVSRNQTISSVHISRTQTKQSHLSASASVRLSNSSPLIAALQADTGLGMNATRSETALVDAETPLILVTQTKTGEGYYRWEMRPAVGTTLSGRGWKAESEPRFQFKDMRSKPTHLLGAMRIEIRCKREDLFIDDIEIKNEPLLAKLKSAATLRNKMVTVEAYLRNVLTNENLYFSDLSDPFGDICLADISVDEAAS